MTVTPRNGKLWYESTTRFDENFPDSKGPNAEVYVHPRLEDVSTLDPGRSIAIRVALQLRGGHRDLVVVQGRDELDRDVDGDSARQELRNDVSATPG